MAGARCRVAVLVCCFAMGMLLFELCVEALFALPGVPHTIALWNTTVQFVFCALMPTASALIQRKWRVVDVEAGLTGSAVDKKLAEAALATSVREWAPFLVLSILQFASGVASSHSIHFVDFTLKVVFKASKLLPAMATSTMMGNSRAYTVREYVAGCLLCCGTVLFSWGSSKLNPAMGSSEALNITIGTSLLAFASVVEGVVPNAQQVLLRGGWEPDVLVFRINAAGAVGGILGLALSGDWQNMATYAMETPSVVTLLLAGGLTFSASIMSYTRLIDEVGSVFAVGVSTLRKSGTVVLSFMLFPGKVFNVVRGAGLVIVLAGLLLAEFAARESRRRHSKPKTGFPEPQWHARCGSGNQWLALS